VTIAVLEAPKVAALLEAHPSILRIEPGQLRVPATLSATLRRGDTRQPLPGETILFVAGGRSVCQAVTNAQGFAECGGLIGVLDSVLGAGYQAIFEGNADVLPATDGAGWVVVRVRLLS
jgi:hypothetical protein